MCLKSIVLFSTQDEFYAILAIQKLFSLGFKPCNIVLVRCESSVFVQNFVKMYGITLYIYKTHYELEKFLKTEVKRMDFILSFANKIIIKDEITKLCKKAAINFHPGLLPEYKGFFSTVWAIINGEKRVGYTYHHISNEIDGGNILLQKSFRLYSKDNAFMLYHKIMQDAIFNIGKALKQSSQLGETQNKKGKYYSKDLPYDGKINPLWTNTKIRDFIRAMIFPPYKSAYVKIKDKKYFVDSFEKYQHILKEKGE